MNFPIKTFKADALKQLNKRWTMPVVISLTGYAIIYAIFGLLFPWKWYINLITLAVKNIENSDFQLGYFPAMFRLWGSSLILMIVQPIVIFAMKSIYPKLHNSTEPVKFSDFVTGLSLWPKGLGAYWWQYLWLYLWMLAGCVPGFVVALIGAVIVLVLKVGQTGILMAIVPICIYAGMIAVAIIKAYEYCLQNYILVDNTEIRVVDSLKISKALTKGYKWKLFCMDLSFIGWELLCCLCPIGLLWLVPYKTAAEFNAFKFLLNEYNVKMEEQKVHFITSEK